MFYTYDANRACNQVTEKAPLHFKNYGDPGHSWLAVKKTVLEKYGILDRISTYSYIKGGTYYLEEDCDATLLIETLIDANVHFTIEEKTTSFGDSPIRNYQHVS